MREEEFVGRGDFLEQPKATNAECLASLQVGPLTRRLISS